MLDKTADLVLEGGGVKGLGLVGAVRAMQERGWTFPHVAGASVGAIVAALTAAGCTGKEWDTFVDDFDYRAMTKGPRLVPRIVHAAGAVSWRGWVYNGGALRTFLDAALAQRNVRTFEDLRCRPSSDACRKEQEWRLMVIVTDITRRALLRLPQDYELLGLEPDEQSVAEAVCASAAIPFVFRPITIGAETTTPTLCVDGGFLSNFPIDAFDRLDGEKPRWPTFGLKILPEENDPDAARRRRWPPAWVRMADGLITSMLVGRDQAYLRQPWVKVRTICVDTTSVGILHTKISEQERDELVANGRRAADDFLDGWNGDEYTARYRRS